MFNKLYEKVKEFIKLNYKFLIGMVSIIIAFNYDLPYVIYKSGGTINLEDRVIIDKDYKQDGDLQMTYVTSLKGTLPMILLSYVIPDWDLLSIKSISGDTDYDEVIEIEKQFLNEGIDNAIISAYNESPYQIEITKTINTVLFVSEDANTDIEVGDEVISVDNYSIDSLDDLKEYVNTLEEGDVVNILVNHDGEEVNRSARLYRDTDGALKVGISFKTRYEYKTPIKVSIKMKNNESGSSGGLMMSLAIYNALTEEDITHGLNIAGTGTIDAKGNVGEIGGIKYKLLGANKDKVDIFLCPKENYEEAMQIKKKKKLKMDIVGVETLKDAIQYLNTIDK